MSAIRDILDLLDERAIARDVAIVHDDARMRYPLRSNTVDDFDEFNGTIGDYYNYHFAHCFSGGGHLSRTEAQARAKEVLGREYRRRHGDIVSAFNDAHDGTNGGLRVILDTIAEALKAEAVGHHVNEVFDRYVAPNSWEQKVDIVRQFIEQCGVNLSSYIREDQPERYASNYGELIRAYVAGLQQTSSVFRRL